MRGPSRSHCAAAVRIGRMCRDLMAGDLQHVLVEFDENGSLATTHHSQGSDMGLLGGLLGWDASDMRLPGSDRAIQQAGIEVQFRITSFDSRHPNTYRLTLTNAIEQHQVTAISTGGGMIRVVDIDGVQVSMMGDYHETLLYLDGDISRFSHDLRERVQVDHVLCHRHAGTQFVEVKAQDFLPSEILGRLVAEHGVRDVKTISSVLPVLSRGDLRVPFITCEEMFAYNAGRDLDLWELAVHYESSRGDLSHDRVIEAMRDLVRIMHKSILHGIAGTDYADRILGYQSGVFKTKMEDHRLLDAGILNQMILYVTAMMEVKSSMGVIVAAPTAGACAGLPGAVLGAASATGLSVDEMTKAMLAAGLIGVFIAAHATFAAEVGGCQAECGAGSGMAAAALVTLAGGTTEQAVAAASMALQNTLGMICDPVAARVEVPCLGKNVMAAANALSCANMALARFDPVIPLDEVIETMDRVGKSLPRELRCTALGGLSICETSKRIEDALGSRQK
ncbi:MAG: L-serine ammonia-lyase, iron-sulfur-dependent, subunit alpha [Anaerolineae bacterium]|nr:L-serine ammonia-lyase, iron-sulfur-dependent, subunit alpha [Anaerolineae bacterium]